MFIFYQILELQLIGNTCSLSASLSTAAAYSEFFLQRLSQRSTAILRAAGVSVRLQISWCIQVRIFSATVLRLPLKQNLIYICKGASIVSAIITMNREKVLSVSGQDVHGQERHMVFNAYTTRFNF